MEAQKFIIFEQLVRKKYQVYNSLIQHLRYDMIENVAMMLPILTVNAEAGLSDGLDPIAILDGFFAKHTTIQTEAEKIEFMFKVIQYVERQVVLFDSIEDTAFPEITQHLDFLSIHDIIHLLERYRAGARIEDKLSSFSARIVLTAHPTQFYPPTVLNIMNRLRTEIERNDLYQINRLLEQLGMTSLMNPTKPTPLEEASNIIFMLRHVYYDAIGDLYGQIKNQVHDPEFENYNIVKLGFWPGGDRDGNPFVTAEITRDVADQLRMTLMKCYYRDLKNLEDKLSFKKTKNLISDLKNLVYEGMFDPGIQIHSDHIISPLMQIQHLIRDEYYDLYSDEVQQLIDKVRIFRTHFASLDIRQDHTVHVNVMREVLKKAKLIQQDLAELTEEELINILLHTEIDIHPEDYEDEMTVDTLRNIRQLRAIQTMNGEEGCNRYIISNSEDIFSVLFVFAFFRWSGWSTSEINFDIIPLFETMKGMQSSQKIMETLFNLPAYRNHVSYRNDRQTMMLGFSDGTKDGGYLKANWSILKTKELLSSVCEAYTIKAIFFDGRGGPPARGGGKTHRFYAAQSPEIASHEIQLTIQGQTITSKFGTAAQFKHNCEQLLTAGLYKDYFGTSNVLTPEMRKLMEQLSGLSYDKYIALKLHPKFIPYLENMSALKYYGKANIGSRPGKRGQKEKLDLTDLRAISFVGSWSQLKQNVPGYYGIGTAIKTLMNDGKLEELKKLFQEAPIFKALILNSMMSLSKCNFELTRYIRKNEEYREFWDLLYDEFLLSKEMVLKISGYLELMDEEPVTRNSIRIREKMVLPLLVIQQYALQKTGTDTSWKEIYEKIIVRSLYGNINASRNSA